VIAAVGVSVAVTRVHTSFELLLAFMVVKSISASFSEVCACVCVNFMLCVGFMGACECVRVHLLDL